VVIFIIEIKSAWLLPIQFLKSWLILIVDSITLYSESLGQRLYDSTSRLSMGVGGNVYFLAENLNIAKEMIG
jgi:hypothetical protein